jgi:hypothetical protein
MATLQIVCLGVAAVILIMYLMRRRSRMSKED